jgi:hypothetical protein
MSQKATAHTENYIQDMTVNATEAFKTLAAWQMKAGQTVLDHALRVGQSYFDLSQEAYKTGITAAEGLRKEYTTLSEKHFTPVK